MKKLAILAFALLLAPQIFRATVSTAMIFEVRQAGSNTNSGCFKEGASGTDFSQQNSEQYGFTNLVIDGTTNTKVTSASHNFVSADVGNCLRISAGTGFTQGIFEIVSVASNAATLDRSAGTLSSTGGTFHVGGALATFAQLNTDMCSGCRAWIKADATYTVSSKVTFNYSNSGESWIAGYSSTRGDGGMPTIQASASIGDRVIDLNVGGAFRLSNITIDANSKSNTGCLWFIGVDFADNIECKNAAYTSNVIQLNNVRGECRRCWVHDGTAGAGNAGFGFNNDDDMCIYCTVSNMITNAQFGYNLTRGRCFYCTVLGLAVSGSDGFELGSQGPIAVDHCVVYNVARDGIRITSVNVSIDITNCVISTVTNGINNSSGTTLRAGDLVNDYNFTYSASGSVVSGLTAGAHSATLSVDPFVNASGGDFRLNNKSTGGGAVRAKGFPSTLPGVTGTFYPDAGVAQHQDPKFLRF
jgi:hypothetical protein